MLVRTLAHPRWALLVLGDVAAFLAFSVLGRRAHAMGNAWEDVAFTALPFLVGWLVAAPLTGAYREGATATPGLAARRAAATWLVAFPLGLLVRTVLKRDLPHWSFVLVAAGFTLVVLAGWRALLARATSETT